MHGVARLKDPWIDRVLGKLQRTACQIRCAVILVVHLAAAVRLAHRHDAQTHFPEFRDPRDSQLATYPEGRRGRPLRPARELVGAILALATSDAQNTPNAIKLRF